MTTVEAVPPRSARPPALPAAGPPAAKLPGDVAIRPDALAVTLARAVAVRRSTAAGALLMRDATSAAKALHASGITRLNRSVFQAWLDDTPSGQKKTNAQLHGVSIAQLNQVRPLLEAAAKPVGGSTTTEDTPRARYRPPKKPPTKKVTAPEWVVPTTRPAATEMTLEYGATHGDLHFGGKPTKTKAKWTLDKPDACRLMEAEITKHLDRLITESDLAKEWDPWYVIGDADGMIGLYKIDGSREPGETDRFACQIQVSLAHKLVSYHGYPDEQAMKTGAGRGRNTVT